MKKFKISPNFPNDCKVVNINGDAAYWHEFFTSLMAADAFAPMLVIMGLLQHVTDTGCSLLATPYAQRYAWIGELMADAEREEIEDAAKATGFLAKGLNDFVLFALCPDNKEAYYATAQDLVTSGSRARHLREDVLTFAKMQFHNERTHI